MKVSQHSLLFIKMQVTLGWMGERWSHFDNQFFHNDCDDPSFHDSFGGELARRADPEELNLPM